MAARRTEDDEDVLIRELEEEPEKVSDAIRSHFLLLIIFIFVFVLQAWFGWLQNVDVGFHLRSFLFLFLEIKPKVPIYPYDDATDFALRAVTLDLGLIYRELQ